MKRILRALVLPVAATSILALGACGNDDNASAGHGGMDMGGSSSSSSSSSTGSEQNDADVDFATGMIPHHQQAVEMADMALKQATTPEVRELAAKIKAAQDPEIETMSGWLKAWGKPVPTGMSGMGHDMSMGGMMTDKEMTDLSKASGPAFDRMWLTMMVKHHQGAVKMAKAEVQAGQNAEAKKLAQEIITAQNEEIAEMTALLKDIEG